MIWFLVFPLLSAKELFFLSCFFSLESSSLFMISISPLIFYLINMFLHNSVGGLDKKLYSVLFISIIIFLNLCFSSNSSFLFLFLLEMTVFPMALSILLFSKDSDKLMAVIFMIFINLAGSIPFMWFSSNLGGSLSSFMNLTNLIPLMIQSNILFFCFIFVLVSKLPIFLFHFWLTKAHVSASGSCSMILASLMLKIGSFGLLKFSNFFLMISKKLSSKIFSVSLCGSILLVMVMIRFIDLKYLIACSSVIHMSLIFPFSIYGGTFDLTPMMFMMTGHGMVSYLMFYLVSLIYEVGLNRSYDFNKSLESHNKILPMIFFFYTIMNLGLPPFINFLSEFFFCLSLLKFSYVLLILFGACMLLSLIFTMFFISKFLFGKKMMETNNPVNLNFLTNSFFFFLFIFFLPFMF